MEKLKVMMSTSAVARNMSFFFGLYGAGDLTRQLIQRQKTLDYKSALKMSVVGACCLAPPMSAWYRILDRCFHGNTFSVVMRKVILDQSIMGPSGVVIFYIGLSFLDGKDDLFGDCREKGLKTFLYGCSFWPFVQVINFRLVPTHLRVRYVGAAAFMWTVVLSFLKSQESDKLAEGVT